MPVTKQDLNNVDFAYEWSARTLLRKMKDDLMTNIIQHPHKKIATFKFTFELYESNLLKKLVEITKHEFVNMVEETVHLYYDYHDEREMYLLRLNFNWDLLNEAFIVYNDDSSDEEQD